VTDYYPVARLLACSCALAGVRILPPSDRLDLALRAAFEAGAFPGWTRDGFELVEGRTGTTLLGLANVVTWLVRGAFVDFLYDGSLRLATSADTALRLLPGDIKETDARRWGETLAWAIAETEASQP
jgi:hypothetical protein